MFVDRWLTKLGLGGSRQSIGRPATEYPLAELNRGIPAFQDAAPLPPASWSPETSGFSAPSLADGLAKLTDTSGVPHGSGSGPNAGMLGSRETAQQRDVSATPATTHDRGDGSPYMGGVSWPAPIDTVHPVDVDAVADINNVFGWNSRS